MENTSATNTPVVNADPIAEALRRAAERRAKVALSPSVKFTALPPAAERAKKSEEEKSTHRAFSALSLVFGRIAVQLRKDTNRAKYEAYKADVAERKGMDPAQRRLIKTLSRLTPGATDVFESCRALSGDEIGKLIRSLYALQALTGEEGAGSDSSDE